MDNHRSEVRDFLVTRRGRVTPAQAGIPAGLGTRRVAGLRRSEVAQLAGVSVEYYTQLERGSIRGASDSVLDAVARALHLDEAERTHLFDLARAAKSSRPERMAENLAVFDLQLTDDEMARIATLDTGASVAFDHRDPAMVSRLNGVRLN